MNTNTTRNPSPGDDHPLTPDIAPIAAALDALAGRDRAAATAAMADRIARASMTVLAGAAHHREPDHGLAATASTLDAQGRRDRALVGPAMSARVAAASAPELANDRAPFTFAAFSIRQWRLAAAIAIGAATIGGAAFFLSTPPSIPTSPDADTLAIDTPVESPDVTSEWATTITLDSSAILSEFDSNIISAATLLDDPWSEIDDLFSEGAL